MDITLPHGSIWSVIRDFSIENEGRREGWTVQQWERFCVALEGTKGNADQIAANALWRTYRVAKALLTAGRGNEINRALYAMTEDNAKKAELRSYTPPPSKLAVGPRRKPVSDD